MKISVLCPTRGRPEQLGLMIETALAKAKYPEKLEFCIWIDRGDDSYEGFLQGNSHLNLKVFSGSRVWLSTAWNTLASFSTGDLLMWLGDDSVFLTNNWDEEVINQICKFKDYMGLVYVNDLGNYQQVWANIGVVHRNWLHTFGYLFSPHMRDNGIDGWITDVSRRIGRCMYLEHVHIEHRQHRQNKSSYDDTYRFRDWTNSWNDVQYLYRLLVDERRRDSLLLKNNWRDIEIKFEFRYFLASIYLYLINRKGSASINQSIYWGSTSNFKFLKRFVMKLRRKNHYSWSN
jgi:hypothetical protein